MRLTLINPSVGRRAGDQSYLRTWRMQPLTAATLAGLTPPDVELRFYDDRVERIPFDEPTDFVAISVETYTAKRAYQIASEYRRRRVPVVMGGFHASLMPEEVADYAESVVIGQAEELWPKVIDDYRHCTPQKSYRQEHRPTLVGLKPNRRIFGTKRYLPVALIESGRGCHLHCDFCAVQTMFEQTRVRRPMDEVIAEIHQVKQTARVIFIVDDNLTADAEQAKEFFRALAPAKVRWVGQVGIHAAHDEELLELLQQSGCQAVLIGFESLDSTNLKWMNKPFNQANGSYEQALSNLRRHRIAVDGTFIFGCDHDKPQLLRQTVNFAVSQGLYIAAFAHLLPLPGTPLYDRLKTEGRLLYDAWWLDDHYRYNQIAFRPRHMSIDQLRHECMQARRAFYSWSSMLRRSLRHPNHSSPFLFRNFWPVNLMHRWDTNNRDGYPLGDEAWKGPLLKAC